MFDQQELRRLRPLAVFWACFTLLYWLFAATLRFTFPFLAGFALALLIQPAIRFLRRGLRLRPAFAAAAATMLAYAALVGLLFLLGVWLVYEVSNLVDYISCLDVSRVTAPLNAWIGRIGDYVGRIDKNFIRENQQQIVSLARSGAGLVTALLNGVLGFLTCLPAVFTMFLVMVLSTYFFSRDMQALKNRLMGFFSHAAAGHIRAASRHGAALSGRCAVSYLFIYFITFLETLVVFTLLGVPYPLVLSIVTGFADILPVLGPGTVYLPLAAISAVGGAWFEAAALLISWLLITAVRQIIEPKIISASLNIHPLSMLAAIYFALVANSFALLIYFTALLMAYQVLRQLDLLPPLFVDNEKKTT